MNGWDCTVWAALEDNVPSPWVPLSWQGTQRYLHTWGFCGHQPPWNQCNEHRRAFHSANGGQNNYKEKKPWEWWDMLFKEVSHLWIFLALNVILDRVIPELGVAFIDGVCLATGLDADVPLSQDKLSNGLRWELIINLCQKINYALCPQDKMLKRENTWSLQKELLLSKVKRNLE